MTTGTTNTPWYCSCAVSTIMPYEMEWIQNYEVRVTKPQLIMGQGMIMGELAPLSFHTFLLFKYPIRVKLTQNILREILDISLDYWWLRYKSGVEIRKLSLSVSSLISIFGLTSVQKIVLNQYKLSILALFTLKFLNFQWVNSTELKMISVSKLTKENKIYYNQVRMIGSSILFLIFVGYSEWKWVKIGPICIFWK